MKYCKESKVIEASEKAYRLIYKEQGFEPYIEGISNNEEKGIEVSEESLEKEEVPTETDKKEEVPKKSNKSNKKDEKNGTDKSK
ncbi:TPA: hypothetical protein ACF2DS_000174 [Clostridium perfringens]